MIAYIEGKIRFKSLTEIFLETSSGVAYHIHISLQTYSHIEKLDSAKIYTYLQVTDDAHRLYGFFDLAEKNIFIKLISVSGVGTNTARIITSSMSNQEIIAAILAEDSIRFSKVKGIGPKTAKRIILDLKDKIAKEAADMDTEMLVKNINSNQSEALSALLTLGFNHKSIEKNIQIVLKEEGDNLSTEHIIKAVLKKLS